MIQPSTRRRKVGGGPTGTSAPRRVTATVTGRVMASRPSAPRLVPQPLSPEPASGTAGWPDATTHSLIVTMLAPVASTMARDGVPRVKIEALRFWPYPRWRSSAASSSRSTSTASAGPKCSPRDSAHDGGASTTTCGRIERPRGDSSTPVIGVPPAATASCTTASTWRAAASSISVTGGADAASTRSSCRKAGACSRDTMARRGACRSGPHSW